MATTKKAAKKETPSSEGATPKKAAAVGDVVEVRNISSKTLNTSKSTIKPGETGQATIAECRSWSKYLEKV